MKKLNLFILFLSVVVVTFSLKYADAGANDWHFQNIGEVTDLYFIKNKLFFITQLNVFGHLNKQDGMIFSRFFLNQNEKIIQKNNKQITVATQSKQILQYRVQTLQKIVDNRFMSDKTLKTLKSYLKISKNEGQTQEILVNDQKIVKSVVLSASKLQLQNKVIYTAQNIQKVEKIFQFQDKPYVLSILDKKQIKIYSVQNGQLFQKGVIPLQIEVQEVIGIYPLQYNFVIVLKENQQNIEFPSDQSYKTIIINQNLTIQNIINQKPKQIVENSLIFNNQEINGDTLIETNKKTLLLNQNVLKLTYEEFPEVLEIFKNENNFATLKKQSKVTINRCWINSKNDYEFELLIQFSDMKLSLNRLQPNKITQIWNREESLAYINRVLFMKYPFSDHLDNEYHRNIYSQNYQSSNFLSKILQVPVNFALRVKEEIKDIQSFLFQGVKKLFDFEAISKINLKQLAKFTMSQEQQLKFGLKKYVVVVTEKGSIYSIDTKTANILWKVNKSVDEKLVSLIKLKKDYQLEAAIMINFNKVDKKTLIQQILEDGQLQTLKQYSTQVQPTIHKLNQETILLKIKDKIMRFDLGESHGHQKHYYFYTEEPNKITGWKQQGENIFQIWNFHLSEDQNILATSSSFRGDQQSRIPLFDNDKVIFKNIDFTNLAILTNKNATSLNLYILNGKTGQVQFNQFKSGLNLNHPVNLVYDQNNVLVSYYNNRNKIYEIWTVEQYQERIQTSAIRMITDYLDGRQYKPQSNRQNIIFLSQVFGFPQTIKKMFVSESKMSLIRRNMVIITRDNKLYNLNRQLVSTRRPKQSALFQNERYPPYMYMLPFQSFNYFSYDSQLTEIKNIRFSSSDMESTIFVFAYGIDNFLIRTSPDRTFDMITADFNYLVLLVIMGVVTLGVMYLRHKAKRAKMIKPHRD